MQRISGAPVLVSHPYQDPNLLVLARLNRCLRQKAYATLDKEVTAYLAQVDSWRHFVPFYQGVVALSHGEIDKAVGYFRQGDTPPVKIFASGFLVNLLSLPEDNQERAVTTVARLLQTSVLDFDRCWNQYRHLLPDRLQRQLPELVALAVKKNRGDSELVKAYEVAVFSNNVADTRKYLPLSLKYSFDGGPGNFAERYQQYLQQTLHDAAQHKSVYSQHSALDVLDEALAFLPQSPELLAERGRVYITTRISTEKGLADLERSLALSPKQWEVMQLRAQTWYSAREYQKALAEFEACARLVPKNIDIVLGKTISLLQTGETEKAQKELAILTPQLAGKQTDAHYLICQILKLIIEKRKNEAIQIVNQIIANQIRSQQFFSKWAALAVIELLQKN